MSNAVIELSPGFRVKQFFGDPNWLADDAGDLDLGATNATLVNGFVFIASKAGDAYLARQRHLGGVGGQVAGLALCRPARMGGSAWGGTAVDDSVVYVNCDDGEPGNAHYSHITAVQVTKKRPYLRVLWRATTVRTAGPPIVADGKVWTILLDGESVVGLNQATGQPEVELSHRGQRQPLPDAGRRGRPASRHHCEASAGVRRPVGPPAGPAPATLSRRDRP